MVKKISVLVIQFIIKLFMGFWRLLKQMFQFIHSKKRWAIPFYIVLGYAVLVLGLIGLSGDKDFQGHLKNKTINDVTQLNPIQIGSEIQPTDTIEIIKAITQTTGPISIGGGRFSMGGQTAYPNSLHIDMRKFNRILNLDVDKKQVTVQPGITWRSLQQQIDPHNLSVKIMQTYANFTVGGSISVNCHGRYIGHGPIVSSVISMKLILADGQLVEVSRTQNADLFNAAVGGYGGIGVIVEATLQLVENTKVERITNLVPLTAYNSFFNNNVRNDSTVIFQNGDLYPPHYNQVNNVVFKNTDKPLTDTMRVTPTGENYWLVSHLVVVASWGDFGKWVRRTIMDPWLYSKEEIVWRNREASYDVAELEPDSREKYTYVLQEYFIPVNNIESFIPKMRAIYETHNVNVINVSLRHAYPDKQTLLSWADEEVFAFVVYYKQGTDAKAKAKVKQWTQEMTDAILSENGKWYLPYQPHATLAQFNAGYPRAKRYFEVKNKVDSMHRFTNMLLDKYNPYLQRKHKTTQKIEGYYREEEQTFLTVPEWYLVFNPKEYAEYIGAGNNPSDFPYYASIDEYWKLYDRSLSLVAEAYPPNSEYITMLKVIGVSVTMEYAFKMVYENTVGRIFSWFSSGQASSEEQVIWEAHKAYSEFIYHTAWYEFEFMPWVKKVWQTNNTQQASVIRKWERMLFFSVEFMFKAAYAELIEYGAKSTYEIPVDNIYVRVKGAYQASFKDVNMVYQDADWAILAITRWGPFTEAIKELSTSNLEILDIGGNDEIVLSYLASNELDTNNREITRLYSSRVVTQPDVERYVIRLSVKDLLPFVDLAQKSGVEIEHVYDY